MAAERLRAFVGATELSYAEIILSKSNDSIVDNGKIIFSPNAVVGATATIDFTKDDGATKVFSAVVNELKKPDMWEAKVFTNGYELLNIRIEQVYQNVSPEAIVSNIIGQTVNLTYASSTSSNVIVSKYIAKGYAIDIIKDMQNVLGWQIRIDEDDNFYFEPMGNTNNGNTFVHGDNINIFSWDEDKSDMINRIKLIGGFESFGTSETPASGTFSLLSHKPDGAVRVLEGGTTEINPEGYSVDAENKLITYGGSTLIDPEVRYDYNLPIIVDNQDDSSITIYGEIFRELQQPEIDTFADARRITQNLLDQRSTPVVKAKGVQPGLNFDITVGEEVVITDNVRNKEETLVITKIVYEAAQNVTKYEFGERDSLLYDWSAEVQDRVKKLEKRYTDEDQTTFTRLDKENLDISLTVTEVMYTQSPLDSFIVGHPTLGRVRGVTSNINTEIDCSNNDNNGTWTGAGIDGLQYETGGFRLSEGAFNEIDRKITVPHDSTLNFNTNFLGICAISVGSFPASNKPIIHKYDGTDGYKIELDTNGKIKLIYKSSGSTTTFTTKNAVSSNVYFHVGFLKEGTSLRLYENGVLSKVGTGGATMGSNTEDLFIGNDGSTAWFGGKIDEVIIYEYTGATDFPDPDDLMAAIYNKQITDIDNSLIKLYLSMDNPRVGDRFGATTVI